MNSMLEALKMNNIQPYFASDDKEAIAIMLKLVKKTDVIGLGGSMTLKEIDAIETLKRNGNKVLEWDGKDKETKDRILHETFNCDVFLTGTNAITEDGKLYNIDGRGNRVAAMIYGPRKVIIVAGRNKIVKNVREAKERLETVAAPKNVKRLGKKTGCASTGYCIDCHTFDRICCTTAITEQQSDPERMHIIIIEKEHGY
jgi:L-lactate utilization protein LutB